jgi:sigma-B regulation protein RsbU (phosphoserine phosphatase)
MASLRQLFDSLSNEQRRNQDLLVSLAFALRSFTNLHRFLELVPVVVSRLVGVDGALIVPFQSDGRLWRDQLQAVPVEQSQDLFRRLASFSQGNQLVLAAMTPRCWPWIDWSNAVFRRRAYSLHP